MMMPGVGQQLCYGESLLLVTGRTIIGGDLHAEPVSNPNEVSDAEDPRHVGASERAARGLPPFVAL